MAAGAIGSQERFDGACETPLECGIGRSGGLGGGAHDQEQRRGKQNTVLHGSTRGLDNDTPIDSGQAMHVVCQHRRGGGPVQTAGLIQGGRSANSVTTGAENQVLPPSRHSGVKTRLRRHSKRTSRNVASALPTSR